MAHQQDKPDNTMVFVFLGIGAAVALFLGYSYFIEHINYAYSKFKIIETWPYSFWSDSWQDVTRKFSNHVYDLKAAKPAQIGAFYNRYAVWVWLPVFLFCLWKVFRKPTRENVKTSHNPKTLLATTTRFFSPAAPWVKHDVGRASWNIGRWRLMESPLMFLIRNRAILDPNGEPFHWNCAYDCGDTESLYAAEVQEGSLRKVDDRSIYEIALEEIEERKKRRANGGDCAKFQLPKRNVGDEKEEIEKFRQSDLVPITDSCYLNSKYRKVPNRLDETRLRQALYPQVGERINGDPFEYLKEKAKDPKYRWMHALAVALFMHGFSDRTKKDTKTIFDAMNHSFDTGPIKPESIRTAHAGKLKVKWQGDRVFNENVMLHKSFMNVFFMALLEYARRRGVVSTASFGWVKAFDRTLWYALNQTGRRVCSVEAAGAWSHFYAEAAIGRTLEDPYMEIAIEGIRTEMIIEGYLNEENEAQIRAERDAKARDEKFAENERREFYGK